jgi:hypothetical protein
MIRLGTTERSGCQSREPDYPRTTDVRFGSKAEVKTLHFDACYSPESGHSQCTRHVGQ